MKVKIKKLHKDSVIPKYEKGFVLKMRRCDVICKVCGKIENLPNSRAKTYKYCSKECMAISYVNGRQPVVGEEINKWKVVSSKVTRKYGRIYIDVECTCGSKVKKQIPYSHLHTKKSMGCSCCSKAQTFTGYGEISGAFWATIKSGAKARNIDFNLTIQDAWNLYIEQSGKCALTSVSINFEPNSKKGSEKYRTCSLDRIDSMKGYDLDNVQWVHKDINIMKNRFDEEYFKEMITKVIRKEIVEVKIKRLHPNSILPKYSKAGDAGMDLTAVSKEYDKDGNICYDTGLAFEIPEGYVGLLFPRSSLSKKDLSFKLKTLSCALICEKLSTNNKK